MKERPCSGLCLSPKLNTDLEYTFGSNHDTSAQETESPDIKRISTSQLFGRPI